MLKKNKKEYYVSEKLSHQRGLIHGFSTRKFGDLRPRPSFKGNKNIDKFLETLGLKKKNLVLMEQVHGNRIKVINENDKGKVIPAIDGTVTNKKGIVLGVKTADCLPILFYDPAGKIIGVVHAGWRGVSKGISQKLVGLMIRLGSSPSDIVIGIGPYIGGCCYGVDKNRAERFERKFGKLKGMAIYKKNGNVHLDLMVPTFNQLIHMGISKKNIDFSTYCTSCQNKEFFSYRKDSSKTYGEILGIIALV